MNLPHRVQGLSAEPWIKIDLALSWICFDAGVSLEETEAGICRLLGITEDDVREQYQDAWRELAYAASRQTWEIRGRRTYTVNNRPHRETFVHRLTADDLFNCRWLDFELTLNGRSIRVSRYDRDYDSVWDGIFDPDGCDYFDLIIARDDLLRFKPKARPTAVRRNLSAPKRREALVTLLDKIAGKSAADVNKSKIMREMRESTGLSRDEFREIWKLATDERPDLRMPGRRKQAEN